jgi:hypothetical protein
MHNSNARQAREILDTSPNPLPVRGGEGERSNRRLQSGELRGPFRHLTQCPHPQPLSHPMGEGGVGLSPFEAERVSGKWRLQSGCQTVAQSDWLKVGIESPRGRRNTSRIAWTIFQNITSC